MADASLQPSQQSVLGGSSGLKNGRKKGKKGKKGSGTSRLNSLSSTLTSFVSDGSGSWMGGGPGASCGPRKFFRKRDLVDTVRKIVSLNASCSEVDLSEETPGSISNKKGVGLKRTQSGVVVGRQLRIIETGVIATSNRYNELKLTADRKAVELQSLLDTLATIKLENDALERMKLRQTPESERIWALLRGAEDIMRDIQEKVDYQRVLHHMLRRLRRNKVKFRVHLRLMEETLNSTRREKDEVESLTRQIESGRMRATLELEEAQKLTDIGRRDRKRLMANKEDEAEKARRLGILRQQRESASLKFAQMLRGDLTSKEEVKLLDLLAEKERSMHEKRAQNETRLWEVAEMEGVFARIRQAMGVKTLEEIVLKLVHQSANNTTLEDEKCEAESKLARAKAARQGEAGRFSHMKTVGVGNTELNREIRGKLSDEIQAFRSEAKMKKAAHERLERILAGVKQGTVSLWQRLQPYSFLLDGADNAHLQRLKEKTDAEVERDTVKALALSETLLSMMLEVVSSSLHDESAGIITRVGGVESVASAATGGMVGGAVSNALGAMEDSSDIDSTDFATGSNACSSGSGTDAAVPPMKNNIRVQSHAQRAEAERMVEEEVEDCRWPHMGTDYVTGVGRSRGERVGGGDEVNKAEIESDDEQATEDMVPNRTFLKLCSIRQLTDMARKIEANNQKKKLAERMEVADKNERIKLTSMIAKKRQQDLAMERISAPPAIAGLPEGIRPQDDKYTQAEAFLTHVPNLD